MVQLGPEFSLMTNLASTIMQQDEKQPLYGQSLDLATVP
jgi:hypothetical protein